MITISPIKKALLPFDSAVAQRLSSPNYDEFQNDREVWEIIRQNPETILKVKMPHCDVPAFENLLKEGSTQALAHAAEKMSALRKNPGMHILENIVYVYEITPKSQPDKPQIGLGCFAKTSEILTEKTPNGVIIRNEGIRESKVHGRADLIKATKSFIGVVNNTVEDKQGAILSALDTYADAHEPDYAVHDERGNAHHIWLVTDKAAQQRFIELFAAEPYAYVADGNHRSAAAAMLGYEHFLTVFFPASTMGISPYNRLARIEPLPIEQLKSALQKSFTVEDLGNIAPYQPTVTHEIGLYTSHNWYKLLVKPTAYDPSNAVDSIDSDIVQRQIFSAIFGIADARDDRLTFVGSNKDAHYLQQQVDAGSYGHALTLPAVTMAEFIEVCRQRRMMPPKSTWFEPKIRSGLVIALLD
jgi:uncharacterized protein (DUF1015 family)